ncbi:MAG: VOC family protein [Mycobacteriales bacterium]|nr:VOC family protein [Frankia sp.]
MTRLQHVNVVVPPGRTADLVAFYVDVLALQQVPKPAALDPRGAWFQLGAGTQIHVSERDDAGGGSRDAHFALVVDDFADVVRRITAAGAPWEDGPQIFGGGRGFTRDPLGNRIEVLENAGALADP